MSEKHLQLINDRDYGFCDHSIMFGVNIERIWKDTTDEAKFIRTFSEIYQHETIHGEIAAILFDYFIGEEEAIVEVMVNGHKLPKRIPIRKGSRKLL